VKVPAGVIDDAGGRSARRLHVVVAGSLRVEVPEMRALVGAGDVLFLDTPDLPDAPVRLSAAVPSCYLEIEVDDEWPAAGTVPPALDEGRRSPASPPSLLRLASDGEVAHLTTLDRLFSPPPSQTQEVTTMTFVCLSPGMRSDWHTEPGVSLVVGLAGGFELGVGGTGGRRTLRPGDVCLVEDFEGQGHTSASDGETRFLALALPRDHRWSRTTATDAVTDGDRP
jgi:quercetin dioxygenase-like cupin family protein